MLTSRLIDRLERGGREKAGRTISVIGVACNLALVLAKGAAGIAAGSISVVADAVNNLMDAISSVVALVGFRIAEKPADKQHPYGHGRSEYLAGLAVSVLIIVAGVELVHGAVERIMSPEVTRYDTTTIVVLVLSILLKLWLSHLNMLASQRIGSATLHATAQDALNDALGTSVVLVGAVASLLFGLSLDGFLGAGVGIFVTISGISLLRETVDPLLGSMPDPELVESIRQRILSYPGVIGTHDLMVHDYGPGHRFASAHVEMAAEESPLATHEIIDRIEKDMRSQEGLAIVLHYDPVVTHNDATSDPRALVTAALRSIDSGLTIHDLSIETNGTKTNLSFDCVRPEGCALSNAELEARIIDEVQVLYPGATCSITFDTGYVVGAE